MPELPIYRFTENGQQMSAILLQVHGRSDHIDLIAARHGLTPRHTPHGSQIYIDPIESSRALDAAVDFAKSGYDTEFIRNSRPHFASEAEYDRAMKRRFGPR